MGPVICPRASSQYVTSLVCVCVCVCKLFGEWALTIFRSKVVAHSQCVYHSAPVYSHAHRLESADTALSHCLL